MIVYCNIKIYTSHVALTATSTPKIVSTSDGVLLSIVDGNSYLFPGSSTCSLSCRYAPQNSESALCEMSRDSRDDKTVRTPYASGVNEYRKEEKPSMAAASDGASMPGSSMRRWLV